jgi:flagellar motor protein MotB
MRNNAVLKQNSPNKPSPHAAHDDAHEEEFHKREHHEEHDEEPWLVSYADMMTLLFGFFVLLYSFASAKEGSKGLENIRKAMAEQFGGQYITPEDQDLDKTAPIVTTSSYTSDWEIGTEKNEGEGKKDLVKKRGIRELSWSKVTPIKELQIRIPTSKLFEASGDSFSQFGKLRIRDLAGEFLQRAKSDKMIVEVHAGGTSKNAQFAMRTSAIQASLIFGELVQHGIEPADITIGGYGDTMIKKGDTALIQARGVEKSEAERIAVFRIQQFVPANPNLKD